MPANGETPHGHAPWPNGTIVLGDAVPKVGRSGGRGAFLKKPPVHNGQPHLIDRPWIEYHVSDKQKLVSIEYQPKGRCLHELCRFGMALASRLNEQV
jgi:hypothetical protein